MRFLQSRVVQTTSWTVVLLFPVIGLAQDSPRVRTIQQESHSVADQSKDVRLQATSTELPDSPGTEWARTQAASGQSSDSAQQQSNQAPQPADTQTQRPVGTAAAEAPKVSGITAAQPSGVAIAPAKQRRVRTIVIKVGAVMAAGAALGAVVALSEGTSSKPPGAH